MQVLFHKKLKKSFSEPSLNISQAFAQAGGRSFIFEFTLILMMRQVGF